MIHAPSIENETCFLFVPEITKTFRPHRVSQCFFGEHVHECENAIAISGSQTKRDRHDWLADYFGLPTDFKSFVLLRPHVTTGILAFSFHRDLSSFCNGLFVECDLPLLHTRWDINYCERIVDEGNHDHQAGYFGPAVLPRTNLAHAFIDFAGGGTYLTDPSVTARPLLAGKFDRCSRSVTRPAELSIVIGRDFIRTNHYHAGLALRTAIPFGNKPNACYVFEPIAGNGHHYELGAGGSAHVTLACNQAQSSVTFFGELWITHLFRTMQRRTFDIYGSSNSRYMLAARYTTPVTNNLIGANTITPVAQFANEYQPIANLTTSSLSVNIPIQITTTLMIQYEENDKQWIFGYALWWQTPESIRRHATALLDTQDGWAVKGDAHMIGFENGVGSQPIPLSATQERASIYRGKNNAGQGSTTSTAQQQAATNPSIDNPQPALSDTNNTTILQPVFSEIGGTLPIATSVQPKFLSAQNINCASSITQSIEHTIYAQLTRVNRCVMGYCASYGFGCEVGFGQSTGPSHTAAAKTHTNSALSFWGIWITGAVQFD